MNIKITKNNKSTYLIGFTSITVTTTKQLPPEKDRIHKTTGNTPDKNDFVDEHCVSISNALGQSEKVTLYDLSILDSELQKVSFLELKE
jgi:hypothetical protein